MTLRLKDVLFKFQKLKSSRIVFVRDSMSVLHRSCLIKNVKGSNKIIVNVRNALFPGTFSAGWPVNTTLSLIISFYFVHLPSHPKNYAVVNFPSFYVQEIIQRATIRHAIVAFNARHLEETTLILSLMSKLYT